MRIDRSLISNTNTYSENDPKCIVVHNTDNFAAGADALAHARAQYKRSCGRLVFRQVAYTATTISVASTARARSSREGIGSGLRA